MMELKKKVNQAMKDLNNEWTMTVKEGANSEDGIIDLTDLPNKFSDIMSDLDNAFMDASKRSGKKGWFK